MGVGILGLNRKGLLDSGTKKTLCGPAEFEFLTAQGLTLHQPNKYRYIVVADQGTAKIEGEFFVPFKVGKFVRIVPVLYVPRLNSDLILGLDFWKRFHLVPDFLEGTCKVGDIHVHSATPTESDDVLSTEQREELEVLIEEFRPLLEKDALGCLNNIVHHIDTGDALPCKQKYYSLNPLKLQEAHKELDERLRLGIVEPSESPYSSPLLILPKKDKGWRWVVDFRKLNESIKRPLAHPLPKIDPMLWNVAGGTIFSSIDVKDAYLQVPLSESSKAKTAFTVPGRGLFQYTRLPAGLKDAAGRWQSAIEQVLGHDPNVLVYMDDILVFSPSNDWEHHKALLRKVFQKLSDAGLTIKMSKCVFGRKETKYLGHIIDKYGIRPDPGKIAAVVNFPVPNTVKKVRRFLGLAGWLRKFVVNFSVLARPLYNLLKKETKFHWGEEEEIAFNGLKEKLCSSPVLKSPDFTRPFKVYTDGSAVGTGAILTQDFDDGEHVIAYSSRSIKGREANYSATELECLGVLHAVEAFRPYLEGYHFELITDHSSLQWLHKLKNPSGRLARWATALQQYDFSISHRKGKLMEAPDALSRSPLPHPEDLPIALVDLPDEITDPWYCKLLEKIVDNPEEYEKFSIKDGRLFKLISLGPNLPLRWVQAIPKENRSEMLRSCHDDPTAGHGGVHKTFNRLRLQAYWPRMQDEVIAYVKQCAICQQFKSERLAKPGMMGTKDVISSPFEVLSTDLIGPLPRSSNQNTFLSVTTDFFSKYVFLKPLRQATAKSVVKHIKEDIILVHGAPRLFITDNGSQYISREFQELCENHRCEVRRNIVYNPRHNPTERTNQTIETMICSYLRENQKKWDANLHELQFALRSGISAATGYSPHRLIFGKELSLDGRHHLLGKIPEEQEEVPDVGERDNYANSFRHTEKLRDEVILRLKEAQEKSAQRYNLRRRELKFSTGDQVWRRNFAKSRKDIGFTTKLAPRWIGPFKIHRRVGRVSYITEDGAGNIEGPWHVDQLKRHYGQEKNL